MKGNKKKAGIAGISKSEVKQGLSGRDKADTPDSFDKRAAAGPSEVHPAFEAIYVRTTDASLICGISTAKLTKLRHTGGGAPFIRCGNQVLYKTCDLIIWMDAQKINSTADLTPSQRGKRYRHMPWVKRPLTAKK